MSRQAIGETLSYHLHRTEAAIDAALHEAATLAALLPHARADAGLSAVAGQGAFDGAASTLTALTGARAHLVRTHTTLAALARRLGLASVAVGPLDKPDDRPPVGGDTTVLQGVRRAPNVNQSLPCSIETC